MLALTLLNPLRLPSETPSLATVPLASVDTADLMDQPTDDARPQHQRIATN